MDNPNPNPVPVRTEPAPTEPQPGAVYNDLAQKKGYKTQDDFAKSYTEVEQSYGRTQNALNTAKTQVETNSQGMYTLDDKGGISLTEKGQQAQQYSNQGQYGQPSQPAQPGYQQDPYAQPNQNTVYDPLTNQPVTDPRQVAYLNQLSQIPYGMRVAAQFNALSDQREKQQSSAFQHETELLGSEAAKGFEQDVKKVMMSVPLQERSQKDRWERALREIKGARYDQDKSTWAQQGEEGLLNRMGNQGLPPAGGAPPASGVQLPQNLEQQFQWYSKNRPGLFKDKQDFMNHTTPTGGK